MSHAEPSFAGLDESDEAAWLDDLAVPVAVLAPERIDPKRARPPGVLTLC
jgi:hypothetical protein